MSSEIFLQGNAAKSYIKCLPQKRKSKDRSATLLATKQSAGIALRGDSKAPKYNGDGSHAVFGTPGRCQQKFKAYHIFYRMQNVKCIKRETLSISSKRNFKKTEHMF